MPHAALVDLVQQLAGHDGKQQSADARYEKAGNGQYIHAKAQPLVETALARLRVGIGGRDCQQARLGASRARCRS
jgi:hypothetical protein